MANNSGNVLVEICDMLLDNGNFIIAGRNRDLWTMVSFFFSDISKLSCQFEILSIALTDLTKSNDLSSCRHKKNYRIATMPREQLSDAVTVFSNLKGIPKPVVSELAHIKSEKGHP